jgi:hypothetical protein
VYPSETTRTTAGCVAPRSDQRSARKICAVAHAQRAPYSRPASTEVMRTAPGRARARQQGREGEGLRVSFWAKRGLAGGASLWPFERRITLLGDVDSRIQMRILLAEAPTETSFEHATPPNNKGRRRKPRTSSRQVGELIFQAANLPVALVSFPQPFYGPLMRRCYRGQPLAAAPKNESTATAESGRGIAT